MKIEDDMKVLANIIIDAIFKMTPKERKALGKKIRRERLGKKKPRL